MEEIQNKLNYGDAIANWFIDLADRHIARGELEQSLKCCYIAAGIFSRQNRTLSSPRIEANLRLVAGRLSDRDGLRPTQPRTAGQKEVCLHVLSEALPAGGLTAMAVRWMRNDQSGRAHCVALLAQDIPVPDVLLQAVTETGGRIYVADSKDTFLHRAAWLRNLAHDLASYIILHVEVCDVISGVAFGVAGGPPVLMVNHAAHIYWNGISIIDVVVNCRGSELEGYWTTKLRGAAHCAIVPIPLPVPARLDDAARAQARMEARQHLALSPEIPVIITVGASFKYLPMETMDFVEVCEGILRELPDAVLLAVGFHGDDRWKDASARVGSRIRTLGTLSQAELARVHSAADVYIEGFPFGTTTALMESGLKGIPVVLAPAPCPPPYGTDGIALDHTLERPQTVQEYQQQIVQLCRDPNTRRAWGKRIQESLERHHTGSGWRQHVQDTLAAAPKQHAVYPSSVPVQTSPVIHEHWSQFLSNWASGYEASLEVAVMRAFQVGLRPRLNASVRKACRDCRSVRRRRSIPLPMVVLLCNVFLPALPLKWADKVFRFFAFLCRGSLFSRLGNRLARILGRAKAPPSPYEEYRRIREKTVSDPGASPRPLDRQVPTR
jgi:hypothetical protein